MESDRDGSQKKERGDGEQAEDDVEYAHQIILVLLLRGDEAGKVVVEHSEDGREFGIPFPASDTAKKIYKTPEYSTLNYTKL